MVKTRSKEWRALHSGERTCSAYARVSVLQAARSRYLFASRYCTGKKALEIGSGTGIGSGLLRRESARFTGMDYSLEALRHAQQDSHSERHTLVAADAVLLPFYNGEFEVAVALEVIEHCVQSEDFLREISRVLSPHGICVLSTPNRPVFSPRGTWLDYHVREYDLHELVNMLQNHFAEVRMLGQAYLSRDAMLDCHPLNRFFYSFKRRFDPRGVVLNKVRAAYLFCRWGKRFRDCTPENFPVSEDTPETQPILIAVCRKGKLP